MTAAEKAAWDKAFKIAEEGCLDHIRRGKSLPRKGDMSRNIADAFIASIRRAKRAAERKS